MGIAIWEPPGAEQPGTLQQLRLFPSLAAVYGRYLPRLMGAISAQESNHPGTAHYYLAFIGVEPLRQSTGIGVGLMGPILDRADREGVPAYLEATTPRNRRLYDRLGFEVTEEFRLGKGAPPAWRMWRESGG